MPRSTRTTGTRGLIPDPGSTSAHSRKSRRTKKPVLPMAKGKRGSAMGAKGQNAQPPVLVRSIPTAASAGLSNRRTKSKRRFDVALSMTPGAEVRLPSLPFLRLGWHILSGLLALGLLGLLYYVWTTPMLQVETVDVRGLQRLSLADVNTVLNIAGEQIFMVNPDQTRADLLAAFPEISAITVEVGLPASVAVTITERVPVLVWLREEGEIWFDAQGISFQPRGEAGSMQVVEGDLPVVEAAEVTEEGKLTDPRLEPELVATILKVGAQIPKKARLVYDPEHGLGWKDRRGWQVYFGTTGVDAATMEIKLQVYNTLVQRLARREDRPVLISVEYVHAPYYRMER